MKDERKAGRTRAPLTRYMTPTGCGIEIAPHGSGLLYRRDEVDSLIADLERQLAEARDRVLVEAAEAALAIQGRRMMGSGYANSSYDTAACDAQKSILALRTAPPAPAAAPQDGDVREAARVVYAAWLSGDFENGPDVVLQDLIESGKPFDSHDVMENWFRALAGDDW